MGGSTSRTTAQSKPAHIVEAEKEALAMANYLSKLGYVPRTGVQIAGLSDRTLDSMRSTNAGLDAFGLPSSDVMANIPQTTMSDSGMRGYTTTSGLDELIATMQRDRPAQYNYIMDMFIDPVTGAMPTMVANTPASTPAKTGDQTMDYINAVQNQDTQAGYEKKEEQRLHNEQMQRIAPKGGYIDPFEQFTDGYGKKYDMSRD